jgi:mannose-6-phosphate isomerase
LFPAILNLYRLTPGQALFLAAGEPHAYLEGLGIELMANSDNVLRGGLTKKHLDVPELIHVLTFQEQEPSVILPQPCNAVEWIYETPADEFRLTRLSLTPGRRWVSHDDRSIDILLCTHGQLSIGGNPAHEPVSLKKGMSAVVPAAVGAYHIDGVGVCYKASVPGPPGFVLDMQTAET